VTQGKNLCNPGTKLNRSKNVFAIISVVLDLAHIWAQLSQRSLQQEVMVPSSDTVGPVQCSETNLFRVQGLAPYPGLMKKIAPFENLRYKRAPKR